MQGSFTNGSDIHLDLQLCEMVISVILLFLCGQ